MALSSKHIARHRGNQLSVKGGDTCEKISPVERNEWKLHVILAIRNSNCNITSQFCLPLTGFILQVSLLGAMLLFPLMRNHVGLLDVPERWERN
jgi:hypothetical protein